MLSINQTDYEAEECYMKVSCKLFGKTPADLPPDLKENFVKWLGFSPSGIMSYIKPGCVILTVEFKLKFEEKNRFTKMGAF